MYYNSDQQLQATANIIHTSFKTGCNSRFFYTLTKDNTTNTSLHTKSCTFEIGKTETGKHYDLKHFRFHISKSYENFVPLVNEKFFGLDPK